MNLKVANRLCDEIKKKDIYKKNKKDFNNMTIEHIHDNIYTVDISLKNTCLLYGDFIHLICELSTKYRCLYYISLSLKKIVFHDSLLEE